MSDQMPARRTPKPAKPPRFPRRIAIPNVLLSTVWVAPQVYQLWAWHVGGPKVDLGRYQSYDAAFQAGVEYQLSFLLRLTECLKCELLPPAK
jgi:hypothetical protein